MQQQFMFFSFYVVCVCVCVFVCVCVCLCVFVFVCGSFIFLDIISAMQVLVILPYFYMFTKKLNATCQRNQCDIIA